MNINLYKKINWFSIGFFSFSLLFMIIGLCLLSSKTGIKPKTHYMNGFGLINYFEDFKGGAYYTIHSFLDIFKNNIKLGNGDTWNIGNLENITNIRCGIVLAIFLAPIFAFISLSGFTYNYINFYKNFKTPQI